jgi:HAE1 family hydrophobic/amphiphilic exporter-1
VYQQFALTIAISVLLSAFLALSLAPALSAMILKPAKQTGGLLGKFYRGFNKMFDVTTTKYVSWTKIFVRRAILVVVVLVAATGLTGLLGKSLPKGFVPDEDLGVFMINAQLPPASSSERTDGVVRQIEEVLKKTDGVVACTGHRRIGNPHELVQPGVRLVLLQARGLGGAEDTGAARLPGFTQTLRRSLAGIPGAVIFPFTPPTIPGFGAAGGFNFLLQDRSGTMSVQDLGKQTQAFLDAARQRPELANLFTSFNPQVPQVQVELDREKARTLGVPINDVFAALSASMGGAYVNDFNRFGRLYRVYVQAEPEFRQKPDDIGQFYVRSRTTNEMVPLSTLMTITPGSGTEITTRFNLFRSVEITGVQAPGYTSGQAMTALEEVATQVLPREMGYAYAGFSYQEKQAPPAGPTFVLAIVFVFLLLARSTRAGSSRGRSCWRRRSSR